MSLSSFYTCTSSMVWQVAPFRGFGEKIMDLCASRGGEYACAWQKKRGSPARVIPAYILCIQVKTVRYSCNVCGFRTLLSCFLLFFFLFIIMSFFLKKKE